MYNIILNWTESVWIESKISDVCFMKNGIHISQVIGFQSPLRIIAFAKKKTLWLEHKNWQKNTLVGDDERPKTEWWILIERALHVVHRLPEILLSKVCRVDIDVQQLTWTHYGIDEESRHYYFFFLIFDILEVKERGSTVWYGIYTFGTSAGVVSRSTGQK